jgi:trans-aconitate methyltransferase
MPDLVEHWDRVYRGQDAHSWDQIRPTATLQLLDAVGVPVDAGVVDVGGGDGALAAALVDRGHIDLTVLDISAAALAAGRARLGPRSGSVRWLAADVRRWRPERTFALWHDRAVFHFLVDPADRKGYGQAMRAGTAPGALAVIGAFAADGPSHCSGLPVARYDRAHLLDTVRASSGLDWELLQSAREEHVTPSGGVQPFTWVALRRRS